MKLLFLIDDITKSGGTERITLTLAKNFNETGLCCEIFSLKKENPATFYFSSNVKITYSRYVNRYLALCESIFYARRHRCKLIVVSMGRLSVEAAFIARTLAFKALYLYEHVSFESFGKYIRFLKLAAYRLAKGIVFLTKHDAQVVKAILPHSNICVIENINPYAGCEYVDFSQRQNRVLAIGRLTYQKNFQRLVRIWRKINSAGWSLTIVGDGPEKTLIEQEIRLAQLQNVTVQAATPAIDDVYNCAKIYVMTSRYEGLPMVLIEAQGFGLPAIAFDCKTGPAEIIIDQSTGYVVDYDNDDAFVLRLQGLIDDHNALETMSHNACKFSSRFTFEVIKEKWFNFLSSE